jgi:hypothetical protein
LIEAVSEAEHADNCPATPTDTLSAPAGSHPGADSAVCQSAKAAPSAARLSGSTVIAISAR